MRSREWEKYGESRLVRLTHSCDLQISRWKQKREFEAGISSLTIVGDPLLDKTDFLFGSIHITLMT